ncbi:hypothetical protein [Nostoc sp.]
MTPNSAIALPDSIGECLKAIAIANYLNIYTHQLINFNGTQFPISS